MVFDVDDILPEDQLKEQGTEEPDLSLLQFGKCRLAGWGDMHTYLHCRTGQPPFRVIYKINGFPEDVPAN